MQSTADLSHLKFFPGLIKFFSSGPVIAMVWEGKDVILTGRKMLGTKHAESCKLFIIPIPAHT